MKVSASYTGTLDYDVDNVDYYNDAWWIAGTDTVTLTESAWASDSKSTQLVGENWVTTAGSRSSGISHDYTDSYSGTGEYFSLNEGETDDGGTLSESGTWHETLELSQSDTLDPVTEVWSTASGSGSLTTTSHDESSYSGSGDYTYLGMQGEYTESGSESSNDDRTKQYRFENGQWQVSGTGTTTETDKSEYAFSGEGDYTGYSLGTVIGTQSESGQMNYDDTQSATWVLAPGETWQLASGSGNTTQFESYEYSASGEGTFTSSFDNGGTVNGTLQQSADSQWTTGSVTDRAVVNGGWTTIDSSSVAAGSTHTSASYSGSGKHSTGYTDETSSNTWENTLTESGGTDHTTSFSQLSSYSPEGFSSSSSTTNTSSASGTYAYTSENNTQSEYSSDDGAGSTSDQTSAGHLLLSVTESFSNTSTSTSDTENENGVVTSSSSSSGSSSGSGEASTSNDSSQEVHSINDQGSYVGTSDWYSTASGSSHDTYAASGSWSNWSSSDGTSDSTWFQQDHVVGMRTSDIETHSVATDTWYDGDGQASSTSTPYSSSEPYSDDYDDVIDGGNRFAQQAIIPSDLMYGGYLYAPEYAGLDLGEAAPGGGAQYVQPGLPDPSEAPTGTQWVAVGQGGLPTTGILADPSAIIVMPAIHQVSSVNEVLSYQTSEGEPWWMIDPEIGPMNGLWTGYKAVVNTGVDVAAGLVSGGFWDPDDYIAVDPLTDIGYDDSRFVAGIGVNSAVAALTMGMSGAAGAIGKTGKVLNTLDTVTNLSNGVRGGVDAAQNGFSYKNSLQMFTGILGVTQVAKTVSDIKSVVAAADVADTSASAATRASAIDSPADVISKKSWMDFTEEASQIQRDSILRRGLNSNSNIVNSLKPKMVDTSRLIPPASRPFADPSKLLRHGPFDWKKYTPITVETDGIRFWVMNGMTRIENANRAGITQLPAYVFPRR